MVFLTVSVTDLKAQEISINQDFASDTVIMPFSGSTPVYSVTFSGSVALHSDSSFIRVIMIDNYDNRYLIYEAYPMITVDTAFSVTGVCEETCYLDGIYPTSVRIDIMHSLLTFGGLTLDTGYIPNATGMQTLSKWLNDSLKILTVNNNIRKKNYYWRAGRTALLQKSFTEKEVFFGVKYNSLGFEFYNGGLFQSFRTLHPSSPSTDYTSDFDWRNRHKSDLPTSPYYNSNGYGWITNLFTQTGNTCYAFSSIALT